MPSLRASLARYLISWRYADQRAASVQHLLETVRDEWEEQTAPDHITGAEEELFRGTLDSWQVFHVVPRSGEVQSGKVIVYWHGGESGPSKGGGDNIALTIHTGAFIHRVSHVPLFP